jgi:phage major head subunit gpT-like protein
MIINQANLDGIYKSFSTIFREAFEGAPSMWQQVAMLTQSSGRSLDYKWLGAFPLMREWLGDRVIKDLSAYHYEIVNKDFEATVEVDRNDIEDDQIGVYTPMLQSLGAAAKQHPDILVFALLKAGFETLCYDGQPFFDTDHPVAGASVSNYGGGSQENWWYLMDLSRPIKPLILQRRKEISLVAQDQPDSENAFMRKKYRYGVDDRKNVGYGLWQLAYGSKDTLTAAHYATARVAMQSFKNDEGVPLGITPTHLVIPPALESAARTILLSERDDDNKINPWKNTAIPLVVPWLA